MTISLEKAPTADAPGPGHAGVAAAGALAPRGVAPPGPRRPLRVLCISFQFPPGSTTGALRLARFVKAMPEDLRLEVLSARDPAIPEGNRALLEEVRERAEIHPLQTRARLTPRALEQARSDPRVRRPLQRLAALLVTLLRHFVWVPDRDVGWARAVRRRGAEMMASGRFDVVFCSSPPHSSLLAARDLSRRFGVPLVVDLRDPWTDTRLSSWRHRRWQTPVHRLLERRMEASVLHAAKAVIANTPGNRRVLLESFPALDPGRVHVVPNGFDSARRAAIEAARPPPRPDGRLCLLYAGELYDGSERFLEALTRLVQRDPSLGRRFLVKLLGTVGPGAAAAAEPLRAAGALEIQPRVPWELVPAELAAADVLLYAVPAGTPHWIPCKLYDYLIASKPVLAVLPRGDAWEILEQAGVATLIEDAGVEPVAAGLRRFLERALAGETAAVRTDWDYVESFDGTRLTHRVAELLRGAAECR